MCRDMVKFFKDNTPTPQDMPRPAPPPAPPPQPQAVEARPCPEDNLPGACAKFTNDFLDGDCCALPVVAKCAQGYTYSEGTYGCGRGFADGKVTTCCTPMDPTPAPPTITFTFEPTPLPTVLDVPKTFASYFFELTCDTGDDCGAKCDLGCVDGFCYDTAGQADELMAKRMVLLFLMVGVWMDVVISCARASSRKLLSLVDMIPANVVRYRDA